MHALYIHTFLLSASPSTYMYKYYTGAFKNSIIIIIITYIHTSPLTASPSTYMYEYFTGAFKNSIIIIIIMIALHAQYNA